GWSASCDTGSATWCSIRGGSSKWLSVSLGINAVRVPHHPTTRAAACRSKDQVARTACISRRKTLAHCEFQRAVVIGIAVVVDGRFLAGRNIFNGRVNLRPLGGIVVAGIGRVRMVVDRTATQRDRDRPSTPLENIIVQRGEALLGFEFFFREDDQRHTL